MFLPRLRATDELRWLTKLILPSKVHTVVPEEHFQAPSQAAWAIFLGTHFGRNQCVRRLEAPSFGPYQRYTPQEEIFMDGW